MSRANTGAGPPSSHHGGLHAAMSGMRRVLKGVAERTEPADGDENLRQVTAYRHGRAHARPSCSMPDGNVVGLRPWRAAAPSGPPIIPLASRRTPRMRSRSTSSRWAMPAEVFLASPAVSRSYETAASQSGGEGEYWCATSCSDVKTGFWRLSKNTTDRQYDRPKSLSC
jgi:hypothetical protein